MSFLLVGRLCTFSLFFLQLLFVSAISNDHICNSVICEESSSFPEAKVQAKHLCEILIKSDACKEIDKEKLLNCSSEDDGFISSGFSISAGCFKGLYDSPKEILEGLWGAIEWAGSNIVSSDVRDKTSEQVSEYSSMVKLYVHTEYEKAYAKESSPFRSLKALGSMGKLIQKLIFNSISEALSREVEQFACLNQKAKSHMICKTVGDLIISPAAFVGIIKYGSFYVKKIPFKKAFYGLRGQSYLAVPMSISQLKTTPLKKLSGRPFNPVENKLKTNEIREFKPLEGANHPLKVTFDDGTLGIWKPHKHNFTSNYRAEVLAYEIDRKLGLGLVPPTVERTVKGKIGSVQLFKDSDLLHYNERSHKQLQKQSFFDYIIDNRDRHSGNFLVAPGGDIVSIDNGLSFTGKGLRHKPFNERIDDIKDYLRTTDGKVAIEKLRKLDNPKFAEEVNDYLGPEDSKRMMERIEKVLSTYDEMNKKF